VLIIAGSGPTNRNGNTMGIGRNDSLKLLAEALATKGITSLRYDKRGVDRSAAAIGREDDLRFGMYIDDAVQWAHLLKKDARFSRLVIAGHSEGALVVIA
jgi:uncharacterized protein